MAFIAVLHIVNKLGSLSKLAGMLNFFLRGIFISPAQILRYRSGKEDVLLQNHGYLITKYG